MPTRYIFKFKLFFDTEHFWLFSKKAMREKPQRGHVLTNGFIPNGMKKCCVDCTGIHEVTGGRRRRLFLTPLENPLCIHAFVGVTLMTDPTVCFTTCKTRILCIYLCRCVKLQAVNPFLVFYLYKLVALNNSGRGQLLPIVLPDENALHHVPLHAPGTLQCEMWHNDWSFRSFTALPRG